MSNSNIPPLENEPLFDTLTPLRALLEREVQRVGGQVPLARRIGIPRTTLYHLMCGRVPKMETLAQIAAYYDVPIHKLFEAQTVDEFANLHQRIFATLDDLRRLLEAEFRDRQ